uniref:Dual specificity protein phosphatase VP2 n=1 Tax=Grey teal gyrovirus TaxID=2798291 RepID=A0A7T4V7C4_9VIRU|nr:VP2 [Grey teal gyrovirus]
MYSHHYTFCTATPKQLQTDPKWLRANYSRHIALWLQECREAHSKICSCGNFRSHWHQAALPGTSRETQTDQDISPETCTSHNQLARLHQCAEPPPRSKRATNTTGTASITALEAVLGRNRAPSTGLHGSNTKSGKKRKRSGSCVKKPSQAQIASDSLISDIFSSPQAIRAGERSFIWSPYPWVSGRDAGALEGPSTLLEEGDGTIISDTTDSDATTGEDTESDTELAGTEKLFAGPSMTHIQDHTYHAGPFHPIYSPFDSKASSSFQKL